MVQPSKTQCGESSHFLLKSCKMFGRRGKCIRIRIIDAGGLLPLQLAQESETCKITLSNYRGSSHETQTPYWDTAAIHIIRSTHIHFSQMHTWMWIDGFIIQAVAADRSCGFQGCCMAYPDLEIWMFLISVKTEEEQKCSHLNINSAHGERVLSMSTALWALWSCSSHTNVLAGNVHVWMVRDSHVNIPLRFSQWKRYKDFKHPFFCPHLFAA